MTLLRRSLDILTDPGAALAAIRTRGHAWFPLVVKLALVTAFWTWYFRVVDLAWFKDQILSGGDVPAETRDTVDGLLTPRFLTVSALTTELVGMAALVLGLSAWLWLFARDRDGARLRVRSWVSLVAWSGVPTLLVWVAMAALLTLRQHAGLPDQLDPTSLNSLVLELAPSHPWSGWAASLSVVHLWSAGLLIAGVRQWTSCSWSRAAAVVAAPLGIVIGGWAVAIASA